VLGNGSTFTIEAGTVRLLGFTGNGENVAGVDTWTVNNGAALALAQGGAAGNAAVRFNGGTLRAEASLLAANALSFTGNGALEAGAGVNATFAGAMSGNGNATKSGNGNVFLGGAVNGFSGGIAVANGTLGVAPSGADSAVANITTISITGGKFDLADNDLVVRTTSASAVEQFVALGYAGGAWNGSGIVSSVALANDWLDTLGVATFGSIGLSGYAGHSGLAGDDTLVKFTYYGDADLTGVVTRADFLLFSDGFLNLQPDAWHFGDFNYSGVVDGDDWALYLRGLRNQPGGGMSDAFRSELLDFANEHGLDATLVPEPTGLALLVLGAGAMFRRRRRVS
jgi:autotransporter-associated beta strand protein